MTYLAQVVMPYYTGFPSDVIVNTWHFNWAGAGSPNAAAFTALRDSISNVYETMFPAGGAQDLAPWVKWNQLTYKIYNLDDPEPRVPVSIMSDTLTVKISASTATTPETAMVLSYHAGFASGLNARTRRGRVYLGGLGAVMASGSATSLPLFTPDLVTKGTTACLALRDAVATTSWRWVVWSRKNQAAYPVVGGWVDNAPDTQRRRGTNPSLRTAWGSTTPP